ncbi:hypothetical protein CALVIDRAFT_561515 [Calocera viscosa TUFC12733]|uniref:Uncharacterized protein n=1 Tax=Calocera viscosa (strain TUFC12733) TaxID=1330018 RepID=A0A167PTL9_CALVF|nr:hypothetical protein CALVIDRAFT_561515 [Calocera viscosa TUFC12733]
MAVRTSTMSLRQTATQHNLSLPNIEPTANAWVAWASLSVTMSQKWNWRDPGLKQLYLDRQAEWTKDIKSSRSQWDWDPARSGDWNFVRPKLDRLKAKIENVLKPPAGREPASQIDAYLYAFAIHNLIQDYLCSHPVTLQEHDEVMATLITAVPTTPRTGHNAGVDGSEDWEGVSNPEMQYIRAISEEGSIPYRRADGTRSSFTLLQAKTVLDRSRNCAITNFEVKDAGMTSTFLVTKAALLEMYAMRLDELDSGSSSE